MVIRILSKLRGIILLFISLAITLVELYYVIIEPIVNGIDNNTTPSRYWSLAIPVFVIVFIIGLTTAWIGYTMITTPEPVKLTYEEAYENAVQEVEE